MANFVSLPVALYPSLPLFFPFFLFFFFFPSFSFCHPSTRIDQLLFSVTVTQLPIASIKEERTTKKKPLAICDDATTVNGSVNVIVTLTANVTVNVVMEPPVHMDTLGLVAELPVECLTRA